jgi:hypothetical protein
VSFTALGELFTALEESLSSGSDYVAQHKVKLRERKRKADRGYSVSDTESDDADLDRELSVEAVSETSETHTWPKGCPCRKKAKQPGLSEGAAVGNEDNNNEAQRERCHSFCCKAANNLGCLDVQPSVMRKTLTTTGRKCLGHCPKQHSWKHNSLPPLSQRKLKRLLRSTRRIHMR